jgi:photosystem II stability/assembly factor-like uncharacterized protein
VAVLIVLAVPAGAFGLATAYNMKQIKAVTFVSGSRAFAVGLGASILRSVDGGKTWSYVDPGIPFGSAPLQDVAFLGSEGVAAGYSGTILQSVNGGATWSRRVTANANDYLEGTGMRAGLALAVGGYWNGSAYVGVIYRSTDGGRTWKRTVAPGWDSYLHQVVFVGNTAYITSSSGQLFTTNDGVTPTKITGGGGFRISQGPSGVLWCYTTSYFSSGVQQFWRMLNGTWASFYAPMWVSGTAVRSTSANAEGWMVGGVSGAGFDSYPTVMYTSTARNTTPTWTKKWQSPTADDVHVFNDVAFSSGSQGIIGGTKGNYGWMMRTADGGASWTDVTTKVSAGGLSSKATLSAPSTAKANKAFTISGTLRPGHDDSSEMVQIQKKSGSSWKSNSNVYINKSKYTTATFVYKGTGALVKGTYRLRLVHAAEAWLGWPAATSSWRTVTVK